MSPCTSYHTCHVLQCEEATQWEYLTVLYTLWIDTCSTFIKLLYLSTILVNEVQVRIDRQSKQKRRTYFYYHKFKSQWLSLILLHACDFKTRPCILVTWYASSSSCNPTLHQHYYWIIFVITASCFFPIIQRFQESHLRSRQGLFNAPTKKLAFLVSRKTSWCGEWERRENGVMCFYGFSNLNSSSVDVVASPRGE